MVGVPAVTVIPQFAGVLLFDGIPVITGVPAADVPVAGGPVAGGPVAGDPVDGGPVAGDPVAADSDVPLVATLLLLAPQYLY